MYFSPSTFAAAMSTCFFMSLFRRHSLTNFVVVCVCVRAKRIAYMKIPGWVACEMKKGEPGRDGNEYVLLLLLVKRNDSKNFQTV